jgi:lysylphosphatidylglycerol synthetase-like protein (DUF2156 family)
MRALALPLLGAGAAVVGVVDVAAAASPSPLGLADRAALAVGAQPLDRPQTAMLGVGALVLAYGLARRRRLAWWGAGLVLGALVLAVVRIHPVRAVALAVLLTLLVANRRDFRTAPDPGRLRVAAGAGLGLLAVAVGWGVWGRLVHGEVPTRHIGLLVGIGSVAVLLVALAPAPAPEPGTPAQRAAVRALATHPDADSLAPFATRRDKSYVFSADRRAAIGYRVVFGTALASGDPVGEADAAGAAISAYLEECHRHGWRPAVLGASSRVAARWREHGLHGVAIGDEAVLEVATFSLASRRMRNVRQAVARTGNAGVTVHIGAMTAELAAELGPVLDGWLHGRRLRGFSMNLDRMLAPRPDVLVATARDATGAAVAFARFAACAGGRILTLDVAPRRPDAPNGVVERLIVETIGYARASGAGEVSLNFAGLRRVFESDAPLARTAATLAHTADRWIELRPLYRFCAKFDPHWRERSLMVGSWLSIATVGAAAILTELRPGPAVSPGGPDNLQWTVPSLTGDSVDHPAEVVERAVPAAEPPGCTAGDG